MLTVHGQVRRRLHLAGRIGGAARVYARILWVRRLDQQDGVAAFLNHLRRRKMNYNVNPKTKKANIPAPRSLSIEKVT